MKYELGMCNECGRTTTVVKSSNPLAKNMCASCIVAAVDMNKSENLRNLSLTMRIPFDLNVFYLHKMSSPTPEAAMDEYLHALNERKHDPLPTTFAWNKIDEEYNAATAYTLALAKIEPIKQKMFERGKIKWGPDFTFHEIVKLEEMYRSTINNYNITSQLAQDAIMKACRLNVQIDNLIQAGQYKELKEASSALKVFLGAADIDNLSSQDESDSTIRTVADLASYLEEKGFDIASMLPNVPQDEIDTLMDNYMSNVTKLITDAPNINSKFQSLMDDLRESMEADKLDQVAAEEPIDMFSLEEMEMELDDAEAELDAKLDGEDFDFNFDMLD